MSHPHVVAIIPARYASTRLPSKPLIDLAGKPMIQHVYERAKQATLIHQVLVATDHERIASIVERFGGEVVLTPSSLRSGSDRIAYVARNIPNADIIVNIQGDEPLIVPQMIDEAIRPLIEDFTTQQNQIKLRVSTLIKKISTPEGLTNPNVVKVVFDSGGFALYFSRSPIPYYRDGQKSASWHFHHNYYKHIGLYVFRKDFLLQFASWDESALEQTEQLEQLRIIEHGEKIKVIITEHDSIPVDTEEDVRKVRDIIQQQSHSHIHE
ncbi:MAG TPA: 3-deoxy-manno-octulosonate cytidylyltransferase [Bacteroidota bacterium]|nr:3-deoxy-manno-octulosonate cytidylyltransferase [Bacteroidota bacterium]